MKTQIRRSNKGKHVYVPPEKRKIIWILMCVNGFAAAVAQRETTMWPIRNVYILLWELKFEAIKIRSRQTTTSDTLMPTASNSRHVQKNQLSSLQLYGCQIHWEKRCRDDRVAIRTGSKIAAAAAAKNDIKEEEEEIFDEKPKMGGHIDTFDGT